MCPRPGRLLPNYCRFFFLDGEPATESRGGVRKALWPMRLRHLKSSAMNKSHATAGTSATGGSVVQTRLSPKLQRSPPQTRNQADLDLNSPPCPPVVPSINRISIESLPHVPRASFPRVSCILWRFCDNPTDEPHRSNRTDRMIYRRIHLGLSGWLFVNENVVRF